MHDPAPDEQIAAIVAAYFAPPVLTAAEFEIIMRDVAAEMEAV